MCTAVFKLSYQDIICTPYLLCFSQFFFYLLCDRGSPFGFEVIICSSILSYCCFIDVTSFGLCLIYHKGRINKIHFFIFVNALGKMGLCALTWLQQTVQCCPDVQVNFTFCFIDSDIDKSCMWLLFAFHYNLWYTELSNGSFLNCFSVLVVVALPLH